MPRSANSRFHNWIQTLAALLNIVVIILGSLRPGLLRLSIIPDITVALVLSAIPWAFWLFVAINTSGWYARKHPGDDRQFVFSVITALLALVMLFSTQWSILSWVLPEMGPGSRLLWALAAAATWVIAAFLWALSASSGGEDSKSQV